MFSIRAPPVTALITLCKPVTMADNWSNKPRIPRHIGGKDRGETADSGHCSPGAIEFSSEVYPEIVQGPKSIRGQPHRLTVPESGRGSRRPGSSPWPTQRKGATPAPGPLVGRRRGVTEVKLNEL